MSPFVASCIAVILLFMTLCCAYITTPPSFFSRNSVRNRMRRAVGPPLGCVARPRGGVFVGHHSPMRDSAGNVVRTTIGCCDYECMMACSLNSPQYNYHNCLAGMRRCTDAAYFSREFGGVVGPAVFPAWGYCWISQVRDQYSKNL